MSSSPASSSSQARLKELIREIHENKPGLPLGLALQKWKVEELESAALGAKSEKEFVVNVVKKDKSKESIPVDISPSSIDDAKVQLERLYDKLLAPKFDVGTAIVFLILICVLVGVIFFPDTAWLAPARVSALAIFRNDFGLYLLLGVTIFIHFCEAVAALFVATSLDLPPSAVFKWCALTFVVGAAALKHLTKLSPLSYAIGVGTREKEKAAAKKKSN